MNQDNYSVALAGENSLIVYFTRKSGGAPVTAISINAELLKNMMGDLIIDLVPSHNSLLLIFDPLKTDHVAIEAKLAVSLENISEPTESDHGELVVLPVYYSEESGPDLEALCDFSGLSTREIISLHKGIDYRVCAIGFAPGFAYLGEVDRRISKPRLETPRLSVPAGSVAIADQQSAVYPSSSPGGWNLIGLCPTEMFDIRKNPPMPVRVGDRVRFEEITRNEYLSMGGILL